MLKKAAEDAKMEKLYREVVLKEKPIESGFVPISHLGGIKPAAKNEKKEEVCSFGDYFFTHSKAKKAARHSGCFFIVKIPL